MKVKLRIDSQVAETPSALRLELMTESIQELVHFAQHLGKEDKIQCQEKKTKSICWTLRNPPNLYRKSPGSGPHSKR